MAPYVCKGATSAFGKEETRQQRIISRSSAFHRWGNQFRFWWETIVSIGCQWIILRSFNLCVSQLHMEHERVNVETSNRTKSRETLLDLYNWMSGNIDKKSFTYDWQGGLQETMLYIVWLPHVAQKQRQKFFN